MALESNSGEEQPNILLLFADQFRYDCLGASGNAIVRTPNLDALATSGANFARTYTESPVCVPARSALLTGRLPHQSGVYDNDTPLGASERTFCHALSEVGYHTEAIGKMHFSPPRTPHGFDSLQLSEAIPESAEEDDYIQELVASGYGRVVEPNGVRHELYYSPQPSQLPEEAHSTAWVARRTVNFLRNREQGRPFFCWSSFIQPHPPFDPPAPRYLDYDPLDMPDPLRASEELGRLGYHALAQHRVKWTRPDEDLNRVRTMRAYYYACISFVDAAIGEILDELDRQGLRENTLVIFAADHGEYLGDHWCFGKRGFHDSAARIPLLMSWPGHVPAGRTINAMTGLTDLAPTITRAAGLIDDGLVHDGFDLLPLVQGAVDHIRELHFGQYQRGQLGLYFVSDGVYKYIWSAPDDRELLFAMDDASADTKDLSKDPDRARTVVRLREALMDRFRQDGYTEPLDGNDWRRFPPPMPLGSPEDRSPTNRGRQYPFLGSRP